MQRFTCDCGNVLFFGSSKCLKCGSKVGYEPGAAEMVRLSAGTEMKLCENGLKHGVCNWLMPADAKSTLCVACRMNRTIPDLRIGRNLMLWGRMEMAKRMGADHVVDFRNGNPVEQIMALTDGRGVDVAIEALGRQETFTGALSVLRPGGTLSSLGVYSNDLTIPLGPFLAGLGDHTLITTLCPGGKERMRRLMETISSGRIDTRPLVTHRFKLDQIEEAYELFSNQRDGVLKVAITP